MNDVERVDRDELNVSRREVMAGSSVVAGAAVLGAVPSEVLAQQDPSNEISGTVTDAGGPAQGATVVAVPHDQSLDPLVTTTDANGDYVFAESDLYTGDELYHVIARDGTEADPRRGQKNYPFIAATGGPELPDSVVYQARVEEFADPWPFNVGGIDMSVTGLTASTFGNGEASVSGDGADDHGLADGPQSVFATETWGVAFTTAISSPGPDDTWMGFQASGGEPNGNIYTTDFNGGTLGAPAIYLRDGNSNNLSVNSTTAIDDGAVHAVVINKTGDNPADVEFYTDDMTTADGTNTIGDSGYDSSAVSAPPTEMGFWGRNNAGSVDRRIAADVGVFEFHDSPLGQTTREGFVSRRSEV